jgi:hypothetical protein
LKVLAGLPPKQPATDRHIRTARAAAAMRFMVVFFIVVFLFLSKKYYGKIITPPLAICQP